MNILLIIVLLAVGFLFFLIVLSRRQNYDHHPRDFFNHTPGDNTYHLHHNTSLTGSGERNSHNNGDWGARDMSHDHHSFDHGGDSGASGDWGGGDAGGGDGGGGNGGGGE